MSEKKKDRLILNLQEEVSAPTNNIVKKNYFDVTRIVAPNNHKGRRASHTEGIDVGTIAGVR